MSDTMFATAVVVEVSNIDSIEQDVLVSLYDKIPAYDVYYGRDWVAIYDEIPLYEASGPFPSPSPEHVHLTSLLLDLVRDIGGRLTTSEPVSIYDVWYNGGCSCSLDGMAFNDI